MGERDIPSPEVPPYYAGSFFDIIREVHENSPLNPLYMSVKQWYTYILERDVIERAIDDEGRKELIPCKVEERNPQAPWYEMYRMSRIKGISPAVKSFNFKLIHTLLPSQERVNHLNPNVSPLCRLNCGEIEDYQHLFYGCHHNQDAAAALLRCVRSYSQGLTEEDSLTFDVKVDGCFEMAVIGLLATGLELVWNRRLEKKPTDARTMRSELEWAVILRRKYRNRQIKEEGNSRLI